MYKKTERCMKGEQTLHSLYYNHLAAIIAAGYRPRLHEPLQFFSHLSSIYTVPVATTSLGKKICTVRVLPLV